LLASKIALGPKYHKDRIVDLAQRDLPFLCASRQRGIPEQGRQEILLLPEVHLEVVRMRQYEDLPLHRQREVESTNRGVTKSSTLLPRDLVADHTVGRMIRRPN
jgi:hypothetical protein